MMDFKNPLKITISTTYDCVYRVPFLRHHWMLILSNNITCHLLAWDLFELTKHKIFLLITVNVALCLTPEELNAGKGNLMMGKKLQM